MSGTTPTYILAGILAGIAAAVLFGSALTGSVLALMFFFAIPLPLYMAGLGWGPVSALAGGIAGALALALTASWKRRVDSTTRLAVSNPPRTSKLSIAPKPPAICLAASKWPGCVSRPGYRTWSTNGCDSNH